VEIQISIANSATDKKLEAIATMFTTPEDVPPALLRTHKQGHILMVGMRPLLGDKEAMGEGLYGRHWVCLDPKNDLFQELIDNNLRDDARLVKVLEREEIVGMALVNNRYKDTYLEEDFEEREKMLEPSVTKLQGKSWSEINELVKKAHAKGLVQK